ncbi:hypothetical protein ACFSDA_14250 [Brachybacterium rhamnosum]|uniref:Uncharacterized protein n=1 Tax=Brachybacterium rhamnosum TaxID=173361 RepID=A0ABW4Q0C4_9MICO
MREQITKSHRMQVAAIAGNLKARTRAARLTGLTSVTLHLPLGDAAVVADALNAWARRDEAAADRVAIADRKAATR